MFYYTYIFYEESASLAQFKTVDGGPGVELASQIQWPLGREFVWLLLTKPGIKSNKIIIVGSPPPTFLPFSFALFYLSFLNIILLLFIYFCFSFLFFHPPTIPQPLHRSPLCTALCLRRRRRRRREGEDRRNCRRWRIAVPCVRSPWSGWPTAPAAIARSAPPASPASV